MNAILEPKIIFADDQLLILDKPAGWLTHPSGHAPADHSGSGFPSVTEWLIARYPSLGAIGSLERLQNGALVPRAGILHRLDRETSGIMAVAKTADAFIWFTRAFRERAVKKIYRAIVIGVVKKTDGGINLPIGRSRNDPRRRVASKKALGDLREAVTHFRVLERFPHHTYLELKPETGRTHQLRAHLKAIQAPILGDKLYANSKLADLDLVPLTINRLGLHAFSLSLPMPDGREKYFESPLPPDFQSTLDYLRESC